MLSPSLRLHHCSLSIKTAHGPGLHAQRDDLERVTVGAAPPSRERRRKRERAQQLGRWSGAMGGGVEIAVRGWGWGWGGWDVVFGEN